MTKSRTSLLSVAMLSLALAMSPIVAEAGQSTSKPSAPARASAPAPSKPSGGFGSFSSASRQAPAQSAAAPAPAKPSGGFGSFSSSSSNRQATAPAPTPANTAVNVKPSTPESAPAKSSGFGFFGSKPATATAAAPAATPAAPAVAQRSTLVAPTANAPGAPTGSAMMRDLGTQTAKTNATKTLQAAAVGAGVGAVAGAAVSNSNPSSTTTASAQPRPSQGYGYNQPAPTYQSSSPTVVNNHYENRSSGSNDMLTGVLIGQAMSNNSHRERERASQYNQPAPVTQNSAATTSMGSDMSSSVDNYGRAPTGVAQRQESSGMGFFGFLMILFVLAALGALAYAVYNARSAKKAQAQIKKGRFSL